MVPAFHNAIGCKIFLYLPAVGPAANILMLRLTKFYFINLHHAGNVRMMWKPGECSGFNCILWPITRYCLLEMSTWVSLGPTVQFSLMRHAPSCHNHIRDEGVNISGNISLSSRIRFEGCLLTHGLHKWIAMGDVSRLRKSFIRWQYHPGRIYASGNYVRQETRNLKARISLDVIWTMLDWNIHQPQKF